ncbi:hypothetical protein D9619_007834 [Psilocybe cf. subviscida]|uniref:Uncharacterized protein n=1 Tax=Psilocybe cf. subviscida TaxID=2480587 RepID=A0A8H5AUL5_9AGAR|nr:hypothetical protein D9619_007834 [Psilocybe cf. subviscida]
MLRSAIDKVIDRVRPADERLQKHKNPLKPFLAIARWIPRGISPFVDLNRTFAVLCKNLDHPPTQAEKDLYEKVIALHPDLAKPSVRLADDQEAHVSFVTKVDDQECMRKQRAVDTHWVKAHIFDYVKDDAHPCSPIVGMRDKNLRGFNAQLTARALCPMSFLEKYDKDPMRFMEDVDSRNIKTRAHDLPAFLYPDNYDKLDPDHNLCRSEVVIQILRLIFTGESSVENGVRSAGKPSPCEIHGIRRVTPEMVAYVVIQIYLELSSASQWTKEIGYFRLDQIFDIVVELFKPVEGTSWPSDTLDFLTKKMPALRRKRKAKAKHIPMESEEESEHEKDLTGILARRRLMVAETSTEGAAAEAEAATARVNDDDTKAELPGPSRPNRLCRRK